MTQPDNRLSPFETIYTEEVYAIKTPLTVIMDTPWSALTPDCREALTKILAAVGHSPESVRMVHQNHLDMSAWVEPPAKMVAFVLPPKGIALYEKIQTPTTSMVIAEPLTVLLANEASKRAFWAAFKSLFSS